MEYKQKYLQWLNEPYFDEEFKNELKELTEEEKEDRFYKDLEFGTGGIRGIIGAGSNRISKYVIARVTQGFADYLNENYKNPSIAIAYDSRRKSNEFALTAAEVLCGNGIRVFLFNEVSSTPELSFAVRELKTSGGIVITASHNPAPYNGYKMYQQDGYQMLPIQAQLIIDKVEKVTFGDIKTIKGENKYLELLDQSFFEKYYKRICGLVDDHSNKNIKIVYTALNGAGARPVVEVLKRTGFNNLFLVKEQMIHDSEFTTVPYPNPEEESVFEYAKKIGIKNEADILMATDPDSDRVGVFAWHNGKYRKITGNQIGVLLAKHLLTYKENQAIVTTIVSSHLVDKIAKDYNARVYKTLTGFKFIGNLMTKFESTDDIFILGFEESYGYLTSDHARDKDAINAVLVIAQMAEEYLNMEKTLIDALNEIFEKYGYFHEDLLSYKFEGSQGKLKMEALIEKFRVTNSFEYLGMKSCKKIDYNSNQTGLPKSNVIKFIFADESWFAIRPSGTEPKLKIYLSVNAKNENNAVNRMKILKAVVESFLGA